MQIQRFGTLAVGILCSQMSTVWAQDSVYGNYGTTFQDVTQRVRTPVTDTRIEEREQTVYRQQYETRIYQSQRNVLVPVTEYTWQPRWHGRLNPFRPPTVAYQFVPHTRWEMHTQTVQTPVTKSQWVPEKRIVQVPVTTLHMEEREQIVRRPVTRNVTLVRQATATTATPVGSVVRMDSDPPRRGSSFDSPAGQSILR